MQKEIIEQAENLKRITGRINLAELANSLGIRVYSTLEIKESSFIAYDPETECYEIYLNAKEPETRQRFSIAHEIAHYLLHRDKIITFGVVGRLCEKSLTAKEEKQADHLAATMLMPPLAVNSYFAKQNINKDVVIDEKLLFDFAKDFEVSKMAAILRLKELGYYVKYIEL